MQFLSTVLYILLFILCLSILIVIHELGHLAAAKAFKVYCFEYSIGFGPKLFSRKRKNGETTFSLRAIPFGGYVSMYGEGAELPEGVTIPPERNLENIKKWKKSIILVAGVTMNAVLAIFIFLISNTCFPVVSYFLNPITVSETSILKDDMKTGDSIKIEKDTIDGYYVISRNGTITKSDSSTVNDIVVLLSPQIKSDKELDWSNFLNYVSLKEDNTIGETYKASKDYISVSYVLNVTHDTEKEEKDKQYFDVNVTLNVKEDQGNFYFESPGLSITRQSEYQGWKAIGNTFKDFGNASTAIVRAFGSLFTSQEARDSVGGIIAIGFESTSILQNFGINQFMRMWALVSVNLAIVNLLPFPGLDGWQLLVLIVEGTARKKIPDKVKNIVSLVGLALLFGLMILLVIKDVFKYII